MPGGLLKALDDDADPREWIEDCVLTPHRRENEKARGLLHALGVRQRVVLADFGLVPQSGFSYMRMGKILRCLRALQPCESCCVALKPALVTFA